VGRILGLLDELNLATNTMVVFAGDNGYYHGEHGLGDKRTAYDESLRIPLLVRYPPLGRAGVTVDAMALNIDLAPTFLDFAGRTIPDSMQGRSWRPLLEGRAADWRTAYFYCYFEDQPFKMPMTTAVRTESAKLIRYPGHPEWDEVFDLAADPYETRNLARDPAAAGLRRSLEGLYDREAAAVGLRVSDFAGPPPGPATRAED
jgi:arylsulfatase A-like enzyme